MAISIMGSVSGQGVDSDTHSKSQRVNIVPRGQGHCVVGTTGTMAAALAANSTVFAARLDPSSTNRAFVDRIRLQYTTIVAFTAAVADRRLALYRGSGAAASGGTAITTVAKKHTANSTSQFETAEGGDVRIATTAALTVAGITFETNEIRSLSAAHAGAAGGFVEQVWEFNAAECNPIILEPGQLIAVRNPVVFGAAGTWILSVALDWHEAGLY